MATRNRADLKSYFVKNAIPTEGNFADLIDSQLNQAQDGVFKPDGEALSVVAAPGGQKRALRLYASYPATNPDWMISLNPAQDPANAATTGRLGFGITDGTGTTRLFIDAATGQIGVGTNAPQVALDVAGAAQANGFRGRYDAVLNDYRTVNPASNVCLQAPANDRDAWIYRDPGDPKNNWGIYHRQIDTAVGDLPGDSIGFVGGKGSKLQAYVNLTDGSGFFAGPLRALGGLAFDGSVEHIERDGALYKHTSGSLYLTSSRFVCFRCPGTTGGLVNGALAALDVAAGAWTAANFYERSDLRLKKDIESVAGSLAKLHQLRGVSFEWNDRPPTTPGVKQLGFIAQEVQAVVPEAVADTSGGLLAINYNAITMLLVEAIKEQQQQIDELRAGSSSADALAKTQL